MTNNPKPNTCPKCGAAIPADAPQGLCPKCVLLGAATPTESGLPPTATAEVPSLERVAAAFPQLEILELLGRGGMGFVFKARQPHLDRLVALKLLPDKLARDPHFAERFSREARVLARLNHPGIVTIYDFGQTGGYCYLLMEYVDGVNLRQAMQAGRFSPAAALAVVPKICEALQYAHDQGVLHRDIKPANILLDARGRVKIADFGIAKLVGDEKPDLTLTATGAAIGTPQYMAPEQLETPASVDHRADIYSLGVVFYEMLTGELPVGRFSPPSQRTPLDPRVDEVVMRALEKEREKRYQSAGDVKTKVEHLTQAQAASKEAAPAFDPAQDFILCPPRLPRMAKAIIVYTLVMAPVLWLVSLFTLTPLPDHALVAFVEGVVNFLVTAGEFFVLILLAVGGWKLRGLNPSAPAWLKCSIWLHLGLIVLAIGGYLWVGVLESDLLPDAPVPSLNIADGLMLAVALASIVFEVSALVWLRRNRELLGNILRSAARPAARRETIAVSPGAITTVAPSWSKLSIIGAILVGVSLPFPVLLIVAMIGHRGGIGPIELMLLLASVGLFGMTGTLLGWISLSNIRASAGRLLGLPLAGFAALTWPLLLLLGVTVGLPGVILMAPVASSVTGPFWKPLILLVPAGVLTFSIWAVYATARWAGNKSPSKERGVLKWVFLALLLSGGALALWSGLRERHQSSVSQSALTPLPDEVVELVAMTQEPANGVWWRADGTPASEGVFEIHGSTPKIGPGERAVVFIFRSRDSVRRDASRTYDIQGAKTWFSGVNPRLNGRVVGGGSFVTATFPESLPATTVRVGVAIDTWETVANDSREASRSLEFARHGQTRKVAFLGAIEDKSGDTILTLTHNLPEEDVRILAVDDQGIEHASSTHFATGERHQFTLPRLSPQRIREYQFQVRPYRWAEFKNVQLFPVNSVPVRAPLGSGIASLPQTLPTTPSLSSEASAPKVRLAVSAPPRETLVITAIVLSNGVPLPGEPLRAKLWPPSGLKPNPFVIQWKVMEDSTPEGAPWEVVVEDATSNTIAARLRPKNLPRLDWAVSPSAANISKLSVTREARTFEIIRAVPTSSGSEASAADWSVRLQLQSSPHSTATVRGIHAEFVLPANQVAVFELVTRSNGAIVPVPELAAYYINGTPGSYTGKFILADDPDDLDSLTGLPRWTFGIVGPDGRLMSQGLAVPPVPPNFNLSSSLWKALEPDTEFVTGLPDSTSDEQAYGLRIRTQTFASKPGLRHSSSGYGPNWPRAAAPHLAAAATNAVPRISFTFTAVELREVDGKRWLAIDYLDEVQGECQKSFPWETKIPGFKAEVRTSEFAKDPQDPSAPRHQRVEYLLPDSLARGSLEQFRKNVENALKHKTIRLELGQEKLLFELGSSSDTALKTWIRVIPPRTL
ncbi:MAG: protein kinase [Verrucomicrobiae bacterium]|nr:protein kinase [Verrucomicrobiae bacterium]